MTTNFVNLATTAELGSELPDSYSQQRTVFHSRAYTALPKIDLKNQSSKHTDLSAITEA